MSDLIAVQATAVGKVIKGNIILENVALELPVGSIYGITGHNGSGKSMFLKAITGLIHINSGTVSIFGKQIGKDAEFAPDTGILIDTPGFLPRYSGLNNLKMLAMIRHVITTEQIIAAMQQVGLDPDNERPFRTYSTGMRQRLGIAQAIMEKPRLLILDEPTRGIDDESTQQIRSVLKNLNAQGTTILITSHFDDEIQALCNHVFMMKQGQLQQRR